MDSPRQRLDSWKAIAAYLQRDVATVRRWEKREGLPVHRHQHEKLGSVYADPREIDEWSLSRSQSQPSNGTNGLHEERAARSARQRVVVWTTGLTLVAAALTAGVWFGGRPLQSDPPHEVRFLLGADDRTVIRASAVSPDGSRIAFAGAIPGQPEGLWLRPLDSTSPTLLEGTVGAALPFWSPNGRHLGFFAGGKLKKIDLSNGSVETICAAPDGHGGTWNQDEVIVFAADAGQPLTRVPAAGGTPVAFTAVDAPADIGHAWPEFLPGGRQVIYYVDSPDSDREGVYVVGLDGATPTRLLAARSNAVPTFDGRLLFMRGEQLLSQAFDLHRRRVTGDAAVVAEPVLQQYGLHGRGDFSASRTGVLAYRVASAKPSPLVWRDRQGREIGSVGEPGLYAAPTLSPDDTRVAVVLFSSNLRRPAAAIWAIDLATGSSTRLTEERALSMTPVWGSGGASIFFATMRGNAYDLVERSARGAATERVVYQTPDTMLPEALSRDGRHVFYARYSLATGYDTWALPLSGDPKPFPVLTGPRSQSQSQVSPDGRLLSFTSDELGRPEVYVTTLPSRHETWRISTHGGADARWSRTGHELFYIGADRQLMAVPIGRGAGFEHGEPVALFDTRIANAVADMRNHYDVTADARRFVFAIPPDAASLAPFTVRTGWRVSPSR